MDTQASFSGGEPHLYWGELRGYRYWWLEDDGMLHPMSMMRQVVNWVTPLVASCHLAGERFIKTYGMIKKVKEEKSYQHSERVPDRNCLCGIYGWYEPEQAALNHANRAISMRGHPRQVFGVIRASGYIVPGPKGFRAQRARIEALVLPKRFDPIEWLFNGVDVMEARKKVPENYPGVSIVHSNELLIKRFPPQGYERVKEE